MGGALALTPDGAQAQVPDNSTITIVKDTNPETDNVFFDFDSAELGDFDLEDDESITFDELESGTYRVTETDRHDWDLIDISCNAGADVDISLFSHRVTIYLDDDEDVTCTFTNAPIKDTKPDKDKVLPAAQMFINANQSVSCNQSVTVTVNVFNNAGGPVGNGTPVSFTATDGDFFPSNVMTTFSGGVQVTYEAPDDEGLVTITARSGSLSAQKQITVICAEQETASLTPTAVVVSPPSTGDGGLAGGSTGSMAGLVAVVAGFMTLTLAGTVALARRRID